MGLVKMLQDVIKLQIIVHDVLHWVHTPQMNKHQVQAFFKLYGVAVRSVKRIWVNLDLLATAIDLIFSHTPEINSSIIYKDIQSHNVVQYYMCEK